MEKGDRRKKTEVSNLCLCDDWSRMTKGWRLVVSIICFALRSVGSQLVPRGEGRFSDRPVGYVASKLPLVILVVCLKEKVKNGTCCLHF